MQDAEPNSRIVGEQMAVAVLDILGYSALAARQPIHEVVTTLVEVAQLAARATEPVAGDSETQRRMFETHTLGVDFFLFSDTIVVSATGELGYDEKAVMIGDMPAPTSEAERVVRLATVLSDCILFGLKNGIALRGAIASGECFISQNPVILAGKPVVEAFELEKAQQWAGACLADSADQLVNDPDVLGRLAPPGPIVPYEPPIKSSFSAFSPTLSVNWPRRLMNNATADLIASNEYGKYLQSFDNGSAARPLPLEAIDFEQIFDDPDPGVILKRRNTERFLAAAATWFMGSTP